MLVVDACMFASHSLYSTIHSICIFIIFLLSCWFVQFPYLYKWSADYFEWKQQEWYEISHKICTRKATNNNFFVFFLFCFCCYVVLKICFINRSWKRKLVGILNEKQNGFSWIVKVSFLIQWLYYDAIAIYIPIVYCFIENTLAIWQMLKNLYFKLLCLCSCAWMFLMS